VEDRKRNNEAFDFIVSGGKQFANPSMTGGPIALRAASFELYLGGPFSLPGPVINTVELFQFR
jgi:hypothetical protein